MINVCSPCRAVNLLRHLLNVADDKSSTSSKCTALVTQHVKSVIYTLSITEFPARFTNNGPAKSAPTLENGGASGTLKCGKGAVCGALNGLPEIFLHKTQQPMILFTTCLPFGIQYLDLTSASVALNPL